MARFVRRGLRGTARPHLTARPTGTAAVDVVPSPVGNLPGAACKGVDPDLFFAEPDEDHTEAETASVEFATRRAGAVCTGCPVKDMCLALALARNEPHGIFGGLTADERRQLKKKMADAAYRSRVAAVGGVG